MKKALLLLLLLLSVTAFSQSKINYGHNDSVGRFYDVRGIKMYIEVYGSGKPLLLIHGNGGNMASFSGIIPYFAKKYQVIAADSRAHGRTKDDRDSLSFEMMADDFDALLTAMHIDSAYVLGWSDGGINALVLAMRHPGKVIRLASTGANLVPDSTGLIPSYWKSEERDYKEWQTKMPLKDAKTKNTYKIFLLDWLQPNIPFSALRAIKAPSLIIGGDHDLIPVHHTVDIYLNIPNASLWIVPNSGHATLNEHRDEFNKIVDDFFTMPFKKR
ncbi:alpha/beta fold hydrolase [Mucilaginibacter sp. UR6-11]|uniref:alpha/beta fold hydrolase n=1 Tax=Mucilaginibacter sp. UR6-11 TaxID=1435644 RepID=UPI001E57E42D|nr:alpha/beta hydrolase [Mucilaginibacter sp. UR6-11]MCC8427170.1 alpha/beta hydrolase [Mucilaginibacter sp. UR6-11]